MKNIMQDKSFVEFEKNNGELCVIDITKVLLFFADAKDYNITNIVLSNGFEIRILTSYRDFKKLIEFYTKIV